MNRPPIGVLSYRKGDILSYETFTGEVRRVLVTQREDDIKNGRPGFDGLLVGTDVSVWGYDSQVVRIEYQKPLGWSEVMA